MLNMKQDDQGRFSATGYTRTKKKKKALLGQMGDIIQVRVDAAEDMENLCKRVLEKKGVKNPEAKFAIEENAVSLQGESDNAKTVDAIRDLIAEAFPSIKINNEIKMQYHETARVNIKGVNIGTMPHVILTDGTKVFPGGKVNSNCTVTQINQDHIVMNCNGKKVRQTVN